MTDQTPSLANSLRQREKSLLERIHTAMPGRVISYDPVTRSANIQPALHMADGVLHPQVFRVPVVFQGGGGFSITAPLNANDRVLLVFSERAIEDWIGQGVDSDPDDVRRFAITDAMAIPLLWPHTRAPNSASATDLVIGLDNKQLVIRVTPTGGISIGNEITNVDLVTIIHALIAQLQLATVQTALGPQPLDPVTQGLLAGWKTQIGGILT